VRLDGDASAVIFDGHRAVGVHGNADVLGIAGHGFVDRVVHDFVDQVVQPTAGDVADVHGGPLAHMLPIGQVLQIFGTVIFIAALEHEFRIGRRRGFGLDLGGFFVRHIGIRP